MKNTVDAKNSYLVSCVSSIFLLLAICYFGINYTIRGTRSAFPGGLSGCLAPNINVTYFSNFPDDFEDLEPIIDETCSRYMVSSNTYAVPSGYEFVGWDTNEDGSGDRYSAGSIISLSENLNLYAQWALIVDDEPESVPEDGTGGDLDNNNDDNTSDDNSSDDDVTDDDVPSVDEDDEVDNGDSSLDGDTTEGDSGDTDNTDNDNSSDSEKDNQTDNEIGTGSGNTGDGSGTSGGSGDNTTSSGGNGTSSGNNSSQGSNNSSNSNKVESSNDKDSGNEKPSVPEKVFYNFKFMYDDKEYASSICEVLADGTCMLLLPGINPNKNGYIFTGWSLNKDCPTKEIVTNSISVNSSNTYYACFIKNVNKDTGVNFRTVLITIFVIWGVALTLIYCLVKWFKKKENKD